MKRAVGYCRVSTEDQAREGISLEAQRARIEAYCTLNGYELVTLHTDAGISGKRATNRPALQGALNAACRQKAVLVVYSLSRLARSVKDAIAISERLKRYGADFASLSENFDTTSAAGRMFFHMMSALGQFESDLASERTHHALAHKINQGHHVGRWVRFGYDLGPDGRTLIPNSG